MTFPNMIMNCIYFTIMKMKLLQDDETKMSHQTKPNKVRIEITDEINVENVLKASDISLTRFSCMFIT